MRKCEKIVFEGLVIEHDQSVILRASVEKRNKAAATREDAEFNKQAKFPSLAATAPFYAANSGRTAAENALKCVGIGKQYPVFLHGNVEGGRKRSSPRALGVMICNVFKCLQCMTPLRSCTIPPQKESFMMVKSLYGLIVLAAVASLQGCSGDSTSSGATPISCTDIAKQTFTDEYFGKTVTNLTAKVVAAATVTSGGVTYATPEACEVKGTLYPAINFIVRMPTNSATANTWNGKFMYMGGGGNDGAIPADTKLAVGLSRNFAVAGTDGGHAGASTDASYANPNLNQYAGQAMIDEAYRAHHEGPVLAKKIITAFYGAAAKKSYYVGCSNGGREGLVEAQLHPEDFDGFLVGAPIGSFTGVPLRGQWNSMKAHPYDSPTGAYNFTKAKGNLLADVVIAKCGKDAATPVTDNMVSNPLKCSFNPDTDITGTVYDCNNAGADPTACFSAQDVTVIKQMYSGPVNAAGKPWFVGTPIGAEIKDVTGTTGWNAFGAIASDTGTDGDANGYSFIANAYYNMQSANVGGLWNYLMFPNWETEPQNIINKLSALYDPLYPIPDAKGNLAFNMGGFAKLKARGAKVLQYHGWADVVSPGYISQKMYDGLLAADPDAKSYWRLFMVPGMFHCGGGQGCFSDQAHYLDVLVKWVESGVAPDVIVDAQLDTTKTMPTVVNADWSTTIASSTAKRTRPNCLYPMVPKYTGPANGTIADMNKASNFSCVAP